MNFSLFILFFICKTKNLKTMVNNIYSEMESKVYNFINSTRGGFNGSIDFKFLDPVDVLKFGNYKVTPENISKMNEVIAKIIDYRFRKEHGGKSFTTCIGLVGKYTKLLEVHPSTTAKDIHESYFNNYDLHNDELKPGMIVYPIDGSWSIDLEVSGNKARFYDRELEKEAKFEVIDYPTWINMVDYFGEGPEHMTKRFVTLKSLKTCKYYRFLADYMTDAPEKSLFRDKSMEYDEIFDDYYEPYVDYDEDYD